MKKNKFFKIFIILLIPISICLSSCEFDVDKTISPPTSLYAVISKDPTLTLLTAAINNVSQNSNPKVDLKAALSNTTTGKYTVFAPVDAVFLNIPAGPPFNGPFNLDYMNNAGNANFLAAVLSYHVVPREINSAEFPTTRTGYATLLPNNQFFLARAATGNSISINTGTAGANSVALANFYSDNGVVHKLATLLLPSTVTFPVSANIVTTAQGAGLSSLVRVIQYVDANTTPSANLAATLASNGSFTVFAPTNAAFSFLDTDMNAELSDAELGAVGATALAGILRRHVIAAPRFTIDLGTTQTALNGTLNFAGNTVSITGGASANIITSAINANFATGIRTGNGIVHVIDNVLR
jgi:uncharacterized surface protein with fasciclin (FAS1) repeats